MDYFKKHLSFHNQISERDAEELYQAFKERILREVAAMTLTSDGSVQKLPLVKFNWED